MGARLGRELTRAEVGGSLASDMTDTLKETPLAAKHVELGAKMVPFAGWRMPVQYTSIMDEHRAVREDCGVFDISHMGQFFVSGAGSLEWLNGILSNDSSVLGDGQGQYTFMLNEAGGVIDDLIIYRENAERVFLVVNAAKIDEDFAWLNERLKEGVELSDQSEAWVGLAIQGPNAPSVYRKMLGGRELPERNGMDCFEFEGQDLIVCRTGYTGEDGFEFFCPSEVGPAWLQRVVDSGAKPCGLGARDSLRLEVCYPLNGSDLSPDRTPLQAGLGFAVKLDTEFIGARALRHQKENGLGERLVAIQYTGKGAPPRPHYPVCLPGGEPVGELCSGVLSPSLKVGVGMAYLSAELAKIGTPLEIEVRGRRVSAEVVKKPFYKKS